MPEFAGQQGFVRGGLADGSQRDLDLIKPIDAEEGGMPESRLLSL